jgi:uncharacterized membrane protein
MGKVSEFLAALVSFVVLDLTWFKFIAGDFLGERIKDYTHVDGIRAPIKYGGAAAVYILLTIGLIILIDPARKTNSVDAGVYGALLGLVVYGVYDFTNYTLFKEWSAGFMIVDIGWGCFSCAAVSLIVHKFFSA